MTREMYREMGRKMNREKEGGDGGDKW